MERKFKDDVAQLWQERQAHMIEQRARYPAHRVVAAVAEAHELTVDELHSVRRPRRYCHARHHAAWELRRRRLDLGLSQIAAHINRTDHTTAHHSYTTFARMVAQGRYAAERARVEAILEARDE
jgi:chromosomal replication initiation ATPase DnaA